MSPTQTPFQSIHLASVFESTTNPRKHFDKEKLADLTASVRQHGVLVPVLVRTPLAGKFEIIAGARRFRAAKLAGLEMLPVRICEMTDEQVLEVQVVENLQREDVHPLEEAEGYAQLITKYGYTSELLAEKVGRSGSYIQRRIKLADLSKESKELFVGGKLQLGHALLLCRLTPAQQKESVEGIRDHWGSRGYKSVRDLDRWIQEHIYLSLSGAPWKKDDAGILPSAGACTTCPKRTGANSLLFDDVKKGDHCLDAKCFAAKRDARLVQIENAAAGKGETLVRVASDYIQDQLLKKLNAIGASGYQKVAGKANKCHSVERALVVSGGDTGHVIDICRDRNCTKHGRHVYVSSRQESPAERAKAEAKQRKDNLNKKILWNTRREVVTRIVAAVPDWRVPPEQLRMLVGTLAAQSNKETCGMFGLEVKQYKNSWGSSPDAVLTIREHAGLVTGRKLAALVVGLALKDAMKEYFGSDDELDRLKTAAAAFGVDWNTVETDIGTPLRAKFAQSEAKRKAKIPAKSKAPAKAKKVRTCRVCGCTENDCSQCIAKTGEACNWVEKDLCSACQKGAAATA